MFTTEGAFRRGRVAVAVAQQAGDRWPARRASALRIPCSPQAWLVKVADLSEQHTSSGRFSWLCPGGWQPPPLQSIRKRASAWRLEAATICHDTKARKRINMSKAEAIAELGALAAEIERIEERRRTVLGRMTYGEQDAAADMVSALRQVYAVLEKLAQALPER